MLQIDACAPARHKINFGWPNTTFVTQLQRGPKTSKDI